MTTGVAALQRVAEALRAEGGLLAEAVVDPPPGATAPHGDLMAHAPRAAADPEEYAFVLEAVREGHLVHSGGGRIVATQDADLALLVGDRLYALGLTRLAQRGDMQAVAALSEVIAQCARALVKGDQQLAEAAWHTGASAVGWGAQDGAAPGTGPNPL